MWSPSLSVWLALGSLRQLSVPLGTSSLSSSRWLSAQPLASTSASSGVFSQVSGVSLAIPSLSASVSQSPPPPWWFPSVSVWLELGSLRQLSVPLFTPSPSVSTAPAGLTVSQSALIVSTASAVTSSSPSPQEAVSATVSSVV